MRAIKLKAEVGPDRHIELDLPPEIPPGVVEVIILVNEAASRRPASSLRELSEEIEKLPPLAPRQGGDRPLHCRRTGELGLSHA